MKLNTYHFIGGASILLWFFLNISQKNFGFYPMETAEEIGFNIGHIILLIVGVACLYKASKNKSIGKPVNQEPPK